MKLLIVDDEKSVCELLELVFKKENYDVFSVHSYDEAITFLEENEVDIVICDLKLGKRRNGVDVLRYLTENKRKEIFILITAFASAESAIETLKLGAFDYITKPFDIGDIKRIVENAKRHIKERYKDDEGGEFEFSTRIIGKSQPMIEIFKTVGLVANTDTTILLTGESGTGKEVIARAIHRASKRRSGPFVSINCGAFPDTLLESELFGYKKGSFTGAYTNKIGLFEVASGGTLFLDEIAEMSTTMQVKLLSAIQNKKIRRLGDTEEVPINIRIIAATNKNLENMIAKGKFREDLYYRLAVIPINVPPLRERKEDIPELANYFLRLFNFRIGKNIKGFKEEAMEILKSYDWPGNVRELENLVERLVVLETEKEIGGNTVRKFLKPVSKTEVKKEQSYYDKFIFSNLNLDEFLADIEKEIILETLKKNRWVQRDTANFLKISYRSLRHRMEKLKIVDKK